MCEIHHWTTDYICCSEHVSSNKLIDPLTTTYLGRKLNQLHLQQTNSTSRLSVPTQIEIGRGEWGGEGDVLSSCNRMWHLDLKGWEGVHAP